MIIYNIQTNGASNQLVIEVINDVVFVEPTAIAYVVGNLTLDAASGGFAKRVKAMLIGKRYFKPTFTGTGKIYLNATLGSYHKFTLEENEELILTSSAFIACRNSVTINPDICTSIISFISGLPMVKTVAKGHGSIMIVMPGPVIEYELKDDKFIAYGTDIAAYSKQLTVTREFAGKGWLDIAHKMVKIYRGTGKIYFCPNPNKDSKRK